MVQKEFGIEPENIKSGLYYLEDEEAISSSYDEESLIRVEQELLAVYDTIFSHEPDQVVGTTGQHCQRCEYRDMCPFFKSSKRRVVWDGDLNKIPRT